MSKYDFRRQITALTLPTIAAASALIASMIVASPAHADATATVKVRTQRMSDANLTSQQNGWYNAGDRVTLTCSRRGQAVKGFFSFNIPGGWDDLWYKTADGNFVADVDIETGTLGVVAPDCSQATAPPASQGSQGLRVPVDGSPPISRGFGNGHNGIDYAVGNGTPVYAADSGSIKFEGWGQGDPWMTGIAGICVVIQHADKYTGYAHLSSTVINRGQRVEKGDLIGYSGATGQVTGPHLHFEVLPMNPNFQNGYAGRINPDPFM